MKKYAKELLILLIQLFMFYIFPLFAGPTDVMGMVVLIILATFILSVIIGAVSEKEIKYLYPIVTATSFIPSIFIYYNETAMVHFGWYLIVSIVGLLIGVMVHKLIRRGN